MVIGIQKFSYQPITYRKFVEYFDSMLISVAHSTLAANLVMKARGKIRLKKTIISFEIFLKVVVKKISVLLY